MVVQGREYVCMAVVTSRGIWHRACDPAGRLRETAIDLAGQLASSATPTPP
jgi:hypothetical protein